MGTSTQASFTNCFVKVKQDLFKNEKRNLDALEDVILITHKNCPDGAAAAVLVKKVYPNALVLHCMHEQVNQESMQAAEKISDGGKLIIADICPSQSTLDKVLKILETKKTFLGIYDHHQSNAWLEEYCCEKDERMEIIFDQSRCGSKIVYDTLKETHEEELKPYEDFVMLSNDRDLWLQKDPRSYHLSLLHKILNDEKYVQRFLKNPLFDGDESEKKILHFFAGIQKKNEEKMLKRMIVKEDKNGYRYGVIYGDGDSSTLLNNAIVRFDLEYALLVNLNTKKVSIRSKGNLDCATYAEKYGGGGHRCASGFRIKFDHPTF